MSMKSAPYFWMECDCCGERASYGDFSAMSEERDARESEDFAHIDGDDLCDQCWHWPTEGVASLVGSDDPVRTHDAHDAETRNA